MARYLVTGAAGFIGSAVARKLIELGNEVITIDNLSTGYKDAIPKKVVFIKGNCQDASIIDKVNSNKLEAIVHIAGQSSAEVSFDDPVYDLQTNAQSTLLLLKLAQKIGCKKFVYASSMSVYGEQPDRPTAEDVTTFPKSFYAVGKIASENYLRIFSQFGIAATSLRLFNVYGPGQNMENLRQGMVSIFLAQAISQKHIHVKGSKDRYRDFVYIEDVVDAFLRSLDKDDNQYNVFNVATGIKTTVEKLISKICQYLPFKPTIEYSGSTPGDQFGIYGDSLKILQVLGWSPRYSLDDGLSDMVKWALQNA